MTEVAAAGSIPPLELHTLGWRGFQDLCATVLAEVLGQTFSVFAPGRDGGRDGGFRGTWKRTGSEDWTGSFTVQCKHTSRRNSSLTVDALDAEYKKVEALARDGLADVYILLTNSSLTATAAAKICARIRRGGAKFAAVFGAQWISQKVYETPRLRMLVPRIYGLGDLSQILDERAYAQARSLLAFLQDELRRFVSTAVYRRAAEALFKYRFCCLLGEPACGKSTIASALCLHGIDIEHLNPIKISRPAEFKRHWNPAEPTQLFWVDDVFGATQYDHSRASAWNDVFPELNAAIDQGARVIFTSRDYIYREALETIKISAFPLLRDHHVVVEVESLTQDEKEQILYSHIKLSNQPPAFLKAIKLHLAQLASRPHLLPEVARRLSDRQFTTGLRPTLEDLNRFADDPGSFLVETFRNLDKPRKALLALVFATGGIETPIRPGERETGILSALGCAAADVRAAANTMRDSIVRLQEGETRHVWIFRHPTMHDAFGSLLMEDREMLDVYLTGAKPEQVLTVVSCGRKIQGAQVYVPPRLYALLASRLRHFHEADSSQLNQIIWFVYIRTDDVLLRALYEQWPEFHQHLLSLGHYLSVHSAKLSILVRLHACGLLPEEARSELVEKLTEMAVYPDGGFTMALEVFTSEEKANLAIRLRKEVVPRASEVIDNEASEFDRDGPTSPHQYFDELACTFMHMSEFMSELGDSESARRLDVADEKLRRVIDEMEWEEGPSSSGRSGGWSGGEGVAPYAPGATRDRFDDVDE